MQARRERYHHMGAASTDNKTRARVFGSLEPLAKTPNRLDCSFDSASRKADPMQTRARLFSAAGNARAEALEATKTFYKDNSKTVREQIKLGLTRSAHLEEKEKRKLVFTGESYLLYSKNIGRRANREKEEDNERKKTQETDSLIQEKHEENAKALQETQLVIVDAFNQETLKDKVDLQKVRDIRRALRRRYANRKNMKKIFSSWDEENKGKVSVQNVYNMVNRMRININIDEARVLVASVDDSKTGNLGLDAFLELVYNTDDALNVNLETLPVKTIQREDIEKKNLLDYLQRDAKKSRQTKHENQVKMILKNKLTELNNYLQAEDANSSGAINYEKLEKAVKRLRINANLITDEDCKTIFENHKIDQYKMDYKNFIQELNDFSFDPDKIYKQHHSKETAMRSESTDRSKTLSMFSTRNDNTIQIVDAREQPFPTLENFFYKTMKITRHLKRLFPKKSDFIEYAAKAFDSEPEKVKDKCLSKEEVKNFFNSIFNKIDANFTKREFEGFYSSFIYNKNGYTDFNEVGFTLYDENIHKFHQRAQEQLKGPAPHKEIALADEEYYKTIDGEGSAKTSKEYFGGIAVNPRTMRGFRSKSSDSRSRLENKHNYDTGFTESFQKDIDLHPVLQRIEDKVFHGNLRAFQVFKQFDVDKDGYVSHKDFVAKVEAMNVATKDEIRKLLEYLDPQNKGHVNFQEFCKKIRPDMLECDENGNPKIVPYMSPSVEIHHRIKKNIEYTRQKENEFRQSLRPKQPPPLERKTRYGATPAWANTFINFQPASDSPMFLPEELRFDRDELARIRFQKEEKARKLMNEALRVESIKTQTNFYNFKHQQEEMLKEIRERNKLKAKAEVINAYEQQCHSNS